MKPIQQFSNSPGGRSVLLSVKPVYSDLILSGTKRIEFRRVWATEDVGSIVIYASAPVQKIVALVHVEDVIFATPSKLWAHSKERGGGVSRSELLQYLFGKDRGYGIFLGEVFRLKTPAEPATVISDFRPPQSYRYLSLAESKKLAKLVP